MRWWYYGIGVVVLAPVAYVVFVILLAFVLIRGFGVQTAPAWFQMLAYPLIWIVEHVPLFTRFIEKLFD
jgi:uncharacterized membrane protein YhdT